MGPRNENIYSYKNLYTGAYSIIITNSQKVEVIQMTISWQTYGYVHLSKKCDYSTIKSKKILQHGWTLKTLWKVLEASHKRSHSMSLVMWNVQNGEIWKREVDYWLLRDWGQRDGEWGRRVILTITDDKNVSQDWLWWLLLISVNILKLLNCSLNGKL